MAWKTRTLPQPIVHTHIYKEADMELAPQSFQFIELAVFGSMNCTIGAGVPQDNIRLSEPLY